MFSNTAICILQSEVLLPRVLINRTHKKTIRVNSEYKHYSLVFSVFNFFPVTWNKAINISLQHYFLLTHRNKSYQHDTVSFTSKASPTYNLICGKTENQTSKTKSHCPGNRSMRELLLQQKVYVSTVHSKQQQNL